MRTEQIIEHFKKQHHLLIGEFRAEQIENRIVSLSGCGQDIELEVPGRNIVTGLPQKIVISGNEIAEILK